MNQLGDLVKYCAAIGHKGLSASSHLLITIMAGRNLDAPDFGVFALMIASVALLSILNASLISEPMMVYGPQDYARARRSYLFLLGRAQLIFGVGCAFITLLVGIVIGDGSLYMALAIVLSLTFFMDAQERSFFMQFRPLIPLSGGALQLITLSIMLFWLDGLGLEGLTGFLVVHAIGLGAVNMYLLGHHAMLWGSFGTGALSSRDVARRHMRFAASTVAAHLLFFIVTNLYIFILPFLHGLAITANFRAQSAVIGAGVQAFSALGVMAVPMLRLCYDLGSFFERLRMLLCVVTVIGLPILLGVGLFGAWLVEFIYSGKYHLSPVGYWLAGFYPIMMGYAFVIGSALRAMDRADLAALAAGIAVVIGLPPGIWLTFVYGAEGAILAQVLGAAIVSVSSAMLLRHNLRSEFRKPQNR